MRSVGYLGLFIGALLIAIQGWLIRYLIPKWGLKKNIIIGLIAYGTGLTLIAFAGEGWQVYLYMIPYCFGGISGPALQGFITSKFGASEQGELQGGLTLLTSISLVVGPLFMGYSFKFFTHKDSSVYFPGSPYILGALLMLISILLVVRSFKKEVSLSHSPRPK
jgi:DHA1 family tetracycline resistance protein-like MFS transporter